MCVNSLIYAEVKTLSYAELRSQVLGNELSYEIKVVYLDELLSRAAEEWLKLELR